jgi:hypothetical protein
MRSACSAWRTCQSAFPPFFSNSSQNPRTWSATGSSTAGLDRNRRTQRTKCGATVSRTSRAFSKNSPNCCNEDSSSRIAHLSHVDRQRSGAVTNAAFVKNSFDTLGVHGYTRAHDQGHALA